MEEDGGVKAPATRLRRRLSVETDDTKSPSAPSTPSKKRGGRLAAKPQLELIDENTITDSPKRTTRKSIARDITEPEEKTVTPARRSTRTKSNTSLVSEAEEKVLTPARRSTRIKSNTSIVSETAQGTVTADTPRAKRAVARRNSQVVSGSDTEASVTPARTRRTRKGSTTSIDNEAKPSVTETAVTPGRTRRTRKGSTSSEAPVESSQDKPSSLITEVISETPESKLRKTTSETENVENRDDSPSTRKSPRLMAKKGRRSKSEEANEIESQNDIEQSDNKQTAKQETSQDPVVSDTVSQNDMLSISSANLIKDLDTKPKKKPSNKNKSVSDIEVDSKEKRHRTKSWTTLCGTPPTEGNFFSDNESTKKKLKKRGDFFNKKLLDSSPSNENNKENLLGVAPVTKDSTAELFEKAPSDAMKSMIFIEDSDSNTGSLGKNNDVKQLEDDQCVPVVLHPSENQNSSSEISDGLTDSIFTSKVVDEKISVNQSCEPMDIDVTIPDNVSMSGFTNEAQLDKSRRKSSLCITSEADGNVKENKSRDNSLLSLSTIEDKKTKKGNKSSLDKSLSEQEDSQAKQSRKSSQCMVDEVDSSCKESAKKSKRKSSKSISEQVDDVNKNTLSQSEIKDSSEDKEQNKQSRKLSLNMTSDSENISGKKSKRKSSVSHSIEDFEKTENKTTLVLSQIKDLSATDNNVSKSPQVDMNVLSSTKDGPVNKNLSVNYMTSTPVLKKNMEKLDIQMNTSVITPNKETKTSMKSKNTSKNNISSSEDDSDMSEEESSHDKSNLLDNEAEEASDDYKSGDSQDEEERQYERENEIVEKGETLTSEDEISNDSDYEKDSFIVSSDEDDEELLSGSGDDLNMSDNELTMTAKSKKKYNERKLKEQKKASREMYQARHKLNESDKSSEMIKSKKNNRNRLDSTLLESCDEISMPPKKNKRMRLESTLESSQEKSDTEEKGSKLKDTILSDTDEIGRKKKKSKRLSESVCNDSIVNEKEITICNQGDIETDDPLTIKVKTEPKTPQKDLEITTIHFTDREEIEQIQVEENMSMMKTNETSDPLRETGAANENDDDSDYSVSENEEITNNYDSVLKELNKENKSKQIKLHDLSLNLNKKNKSKPKETIVEELNLTQTKKSKKKVRDTPEQSKEKTVKRVFKKLADNDDDASGDSIDLKLLFSDESNDNNDGFIPLKPTPGKTNIFNHTDSNVNNNGNQLQFFIDTKGDLSDTESSTKESPNASSMKNIKSPDINDDSSDDAPVETSYISEKKRNKKTSVTIDTSIMGKSLNSTLNKTPKSEKKKSQETEATEMPVPKTPASQKKKKLSMSCENQTEVTQSPSSVPKTPTVTSEKKKKNKLETPGSEKQKKKLSESIENPTGGLESSVSHPKTPISAKKKKKLSETCEETVVDAPEFVISKEQTPSSETKQRKLSGFEVENIMESAEGDAIKDRKRKRKSSANHTSEEIVVEDTMNNSGKLNESIGNKKKKRKISETKDNFVPVQATTSPNNQDVLPVTGESNSKKANKKKDKSLDENMALTAQQPVIETKIGKKRKERDDDDGGKKSKVLKEHSLDKIHVPRLPPSLINQLDDKPKAELLEMKKAKLVSTTDFVVEETRRRRNKPSNFLEESVYLNDDDNAPVAKKKSIVKKPKVLPFLPTVSTSDNGFTTNFQVNVISQTMEFVAKKNEMPHFKEDYLNDRKIKKMRTYDLYKKHRNVKLSKF